MFINRLSLAFAVAMLPLVAVEAPHARNSSQNPLARAKGLKCDFPLHAVGTWQDGEAKAELRESTFSIAFESIDTRDGFATAVGGFGPSNIIVRFAAGSLHLMQIGPSGPLYVTTVFSRETNDGRLQAVHSRHEYTEVSLPGFTSRPEQYYGECDVELGPAL